MKKTISLLLTLLCLVGLLTACSVYSGSPTEKQSTTSSDANDWGDLPNFDGALSTPDFASNAILWEASVMGGTLIINDEYRIISAGASEAAGVAAATLRTNIQTATKFELDVTTDRVEVGSDEYVLSDKEILVGLTENRGVIQDIMKEHGTTLAYTTNSLGAFFIGAKNGKLMILASDEGSLTAAVNFFCKQYVYGQKSVKVQGDLASVYIFDKQEFDKNRVFAFYSLNDLRSNTVVTDILLDGQKLSTFSGDTFAYTINLFRSQSVPTLSAASWSPMANVTVVQPSADNNWQGSVHISCGAAEEKTYSITYNRLGYDIVDGAIMHNLKNGATGAVTLVQDDGFKGATEIMIDICKKYGLKFNVAMVANKIGSLDTDANGKYIIDENGNYQITFTADNKGLSGGGTPGWWKQTLKDNPDLIEITCHSLTHGSWGLSEEKLAAELIGAQQILQRAFEGQRALTFAYPGYTSDNRDYEYSLAKAMMPDYYVAARFLSMGKGNSIKNPDYFYLNACGLYTIPQSEWGKGLSNSDGWFMNSINSAAKSGGWVVTLGHSIEDNNDLPKNSMTISTAYFEYYCKNYLADYVASGALWNGFFSEVAQYVNEYNHATMECRAYSEDKIGVLLTDTVDDVLYDYPLTIDVAVNDSWGSATFTYTNRAGEQITETLSVSTAKDGSHFVRIQLVPDCGEAILTAGN